MIVLFFLLWVILNGQFTLEIALFGVVISAAVYWFVCRFMGYSPKKDIKALKNLGRGITFVLCLVWEIIKANVGVIRLILSSKYINEPVLVKFRTGLQSEAAKVALANSITLTPGTITVTLEGDELCVHCLDKDMAQGLDDSVFEKRLKKMEG